MPHELEVPSPAGVEEARRRIAGIALRTPLVRLLADAGPAEIWLKLECLQPIGSFKIRGAANAMLALPREALARGVVTASAGNMAQGVAWMARRLGVPATVIAPDSAPATKVRAIERLGARLVRVPFDQWWKAFEERSFPGVEGTFVHAFDDLRVMAGNGTIGREIVEDLPDVDAVVAPWGGGGLACGIAAALLGTRPSCRVFAAEVETATPLAAALAAGGPRSVDYRPSFVDGIGSRSVFPRMLERGRTLLEGSLVATLDATRAAIRLVAERNHVIAEGAAATAVACALAGGAGAGKVACVVSGGNIDLATLAEVLAG